MVLLWSYLAGNWFTVRTDYEALKWPWRLSDAFKKLMWCRPWLPETFLYKYHAGIQQNETKEFSRLRTVGTKKTRRWDGVTALTVGLWIYEVFFTYLISQKEDEEECSDDLKEYFVSFCRGLCTSRQSERLEHNTPHLHEFITLGIVKNNCQCSPAAIWILENVIPKRYKCRTYQGVASTRHIRRIRISWSKTLHAASFPWWFYCRSFRAWCTWDSVQPEFYVPQIANDLFAAIQDCHACLRKRHWSGR